MMSGEQQKYLLASKQIKRLEVAALNKKVDALLGFIRSPEQGCPPLIIYLNNGVMSGCNVLDSMLVGIF